jgi:hypothetical protein
VAANRRKRVWTSAESPTEGPDARKEPSSARRSVFATPPSGACEPPALTARNSAELRSARIRQQALTESGRNLGPRPAWPNEGNQRRRAGGGCSASARRFRTGTDRHAAEHRCGDRRAPASGTTPRSRPARQQIPGAHRDAQNRMICARHTEPPPWLLAVPIRRSGRDGTAGVSCLWVMHSGGSSPLPVGQHRS